MALHAENMNQVQDWGESVPPDTWYHVRISKVEEKESTTGNPKVQLVLKVQDEPFVGRTIPDSPSLQAHALMKIKAYYTACEYFPGPEGHDPEMLLDRECFVKPTEQMLQGEKRLDIKPHHIKSLRDGRPQK